MKDPVRGTMLMLVVAAIAVRLLAVMIAVATTDLRPDDLARLRDGPAYLAYASAITEGFAGLAEYDRRVFPGYPLLLALIGAVRWPLIAVEVFVRRLLVRLTRVMALPRGGEDERGQAIHGVGRFLGVTDQNQQEDRRTACIWTPPVQHNGSCQRIPSA
jgi:hypothetical protein